MDKMDELEAHVAKLEQQVDEITERVDRMMRLQVVNGIKTEGGSLIVETRELGEPGRYLRTPYNGSSS